jgi:DNA-3-methyladenine glycosylase II
MFNDRNPHLHLSKQDKILKKLIQIFGDYELKPKKYPFDSLVKTVISQQLSGSASNTITSRIENIHGKRPFKSDKILSLNIDELKSCGVSTSKIKTIIGLAEADIRGEFSKKRFNKLSDEEVIEVLTSYWGIGRWTSEIFLMFTLGRLDVLANNDVGLERSHSILYPNSPSIQITSEKWKPYRTIASWYLWKFIDNQEMCEGLI